MGAARDPAVESADAGRTTPVTEPPDSLFARAERLVARALTFDAAMREKWVAEACAGDAPLAREVRVLLQLTEAAPDFLTGTALVDLAGARAGDFAPEALVGQRVGPYRVGPHGLFQPIADGLKPVRPGCLNYLHASQLGLHRFDHKGGVA